LVADHAADFAAQYAPAFGKLSQDSADSTLSTDPPPFAAMAGAKARLRVDMEKNLGLLGTLGNNAPFIGLFGTVIGVVQAFEALGRQDATAAAAEAAKGMAPQEVMVAIAEALVATAVGLAVAIPAVAMYNVYQRRLKSILANTDALSSVLLAHLVAVGGPRVHVQDDED
jgi:biopolymer transport protein ExbB/TolQ